MKHLTDKQLFKDLKFYVKKEKHYTFLVLKHLQEVDSRRSYADLGFSSLYKYVIRELGFGEGEAYLRISAMRLMNRSKKCEAKLENGSISLTNASKLGSSLNRKSSVKESTLDMLIEDISGKSKRVAEEIILETLELPPSKEKVIKIHEKLASKMDRARKLYGDVTDSELLEILLDEKLSFVSAKNKTKVTPKNSRYIPIRVKEAVQKRSKMRCESTMPGNGTRCQERRNLQYDHRIPFSMGGDNSIKNIRHLCPSHNLKAARDIGLSNK